MLYLTRINYTYGRYVITIFSFSSLMFHICDLPLKFEICIELVLGILYLKADSNLCNMASANLLDDVEDGKSLWFIRLTLLS